MEEKGRIEEDDENDKVGEASRERERGDTSERWLESEDGKRLILKLHIYIYIYIKCHEYSSFKL